MPHFPHMISSKRLLRAPQMAQQAPVYQQCSAAVLVGTLVLPCKLAAGVTPLGTVAGAISIHFLGLRYQQLCTDSHTTDRRRGIAQSMWTLCRACQSKDWPDHKRACSDQAEQQAADASAKEQLAQPVTHGSLLQCQRDVLAALAPLARLAGLWPLAQRVRPAVLQHFRTVLAALGFTAATALQDQHRGAAAAGAAVAVGLCIIATQLSGCDTDENPSTRHRQVVARLCSVCDAAAELRSVAPFDNECAWRNSLHLLTMGCKAASGTFDGCDDDNHAEDTHIQDKMQDAGAAALQAVTSHPDEAVRLDAMAALHVRFLLLCHVSRYV